MTIKITYRSHKYLVISLLFLIFTNHEVKAYAELLPLTTPNYSLSGNEISINCNTISGPNWRNMFEGNLFNFQVRNGYVDKNGRTQNLVSYIGLYEFFYNTVMHTSGNTFTKIREYLDFPFEIGNILSNSKLHYYWRFPEIKANAYDWFFSNYIGMNSALFQGKDINPIYSLKPQFGLRLGFQKIFNKNFINDNDFCKSNIDVLVPTDKVELLGIYIDLGYRYSFDFQKGSKPVSMGNFFLSIGIISSCFNNYSK